MSEIMEFAPDGPDFGPFAALSGPIATILAIILGLIGVLGLLLLVIGLLKLVVSRGDIHKREAAMGNVKYGALGVAIPLVFVFGLSVFQAVGESVTQ